MASLALNEVFSGVKISQFPPPPSGQVITLPADMTVEQAVKELSKANILAAPVYDPESTQEDSWSTKYVGVLDAVGIVFAMLDTYDAGAKHGFWEQMAVEKKFAKTKIGDLAGTFRWGPFIPLEPDSSLLDALLLMGKYGVHRLPVVEVVGDMTNILTQSSIVKMLHDNADLFTLVGKQTLAEVGLADPAPQGVFSVPIDSPTVDAFKLIRDKRVSAVAVTGRQGMLIGTVSARDVRAVLSSPKLFSVLSQPLSHFFEQIHRLEADLRSPAVQCSATDTLQGVIAKLSTVKIHRVFLCDKEGRPVRVVSLSDVISQYVIEPDNYFGNYFCHGLPLGPGI